MRLQSIPGCIFRLPLY